MPSSLPLFWIPSWCIWKFGLYPVFPLHKKRVLNEDRDSLDDRSVSLFELTILFCFFTRTVRPGLLPPLKTVDENHLSSFLNFSFQLLFLFSLRLYWDRNIFPSELSFFFRQCQTNLQPIAPQDPTILSYRFSCLSFYRCRENLAPLFLSPPFSPLTQFRTSPLVELWCS